MGALNLASRIPGERVELRAPSVHDARELVELRRRSWEFLAPWSPEERGWERDVEGTREKIRAERAEWRADRGYRFVITLRNGGRILGLVALGNVVRGVFQNASLGYLLDRGQTGKGYATEAVELALAAAFGPLGLHRVEAGVIPGNRPSLAVLRRAGFRRIGVSRRYLRIAGSWQDHLLFERTVEDWRR